MDKVSGLLRNRWLRLTLEALIVLAPAFPLARLSDSFGQDWYNHSWVIAYTAEHLRNHGSLPTFLNTTSHIGLAAPIFYGYLLFPIAGALALVTGPQLALRLLALAAFALEYVLVRATVLEAGAGLATAITTATLVT